MRKVEFRTYDPTKVMRIVLEQINLIIELLARLQYFVICVVKNNDKELGAEQTFLKFKSRRFFIELYCVYLVWTQNIINLRN